MCTITWNSNFSLYDRFCLLSHSLERPQADPRGYGLLFVDASRKAGHGSSLSHSCAPTCEVRVAAFDGELCLAMTTLRELEMGEELTFDYNAVTESLNEYSSAVCLCGYGRCRGSFLHFATADCYQQVLNRNSPIATRFSNLVKGSMKQVMSPDDDQVLMNHGFLTASFGAISVNRRVASSVGNGDALADSLDNVPVWLRTYVADVLRYIEYERRALPIALICEHLATSKKGGQKSSTVVMTKEPKSEPAFFYFSRTESQFVLSLLKKQGMPDSLTGLQLKHAMQKVASGYWGALTDEKKQDWKNRARANFEKKLKLWRSGKRKLPDKNQEKEKSKPEIHDILHSSKISFQDADAEGVVAMEQRIQQLSQTLSRVGRALDRHREGSFDTDNRSMCETESPESLRKMVQSPIRVLSDAEVIGWMWNNSNGVFQALVRSINSARCVRPDLLEGLIQIRKKYVTLEEFRDSESDFVDQTTPSPIDSRCQLTIALLESRDLILAELQCMTREFRETRAQQMDEARTQNTSPVLSDDMIDGKLDSVISTVSPLEAHLTATPGDSSAIETFSDEIIVTATTEDVAPNEAKMSVEEKLPLLRHPWLEFYHERFTLHAAADVLLLYARTTNFFVLQPYRPLMSTPVEVYARELGNVVPRSAVDEELSLTMKEPALPTETVAGVQKQNNFLQQDSGNGIDSPINQAETKRVVVDVCNPDDVVSMVAIQYQGDYVLSQLLQWYNAGIGQKPGLPDMLGCTLLPKISDCWDSELLRNSKMKSDRKTSYETKIRPRLVEWLQDPYQRGNPWPLEIRKAFLGDSSSLLKSDTSTMFLPFGSPIVDFLVTGDESNISAILNELDADDKIAVKKSGDGLLSSIDKGRPAQAVSNWVQCEHPECMKWRKIPWFVDLDLLPENFFCEDNKWNPNSNNCNSPEDEWGASDALVGLDGKVEGSPAKKKPEERLSINDESSFQIGSECCG